ncbi:hypothetical protein [Adhaeribacter terreus]|uniref:STAS/SEC14 domain-containing protein n=1 Tax=Adhaeribacter terreus TaxID=529703 RepID=A0ABW0E7Z4_9BACT
MKKEISNAFGKVFLTIEYQQEKNWVENTWLGYQTTESIMKGANVCIEELKANHCAYLLNDNQQVVGPWDHATDWIAQDWTPRAIAAGLTHFAHVVSPESLAAMSAEMMQTKIEGSFNMKAFDNQEEAKAWLMAAQKDA